MELRKCFDSRNDVLHTRGMRPDLASIQTRFGKSAERQAPRFKVDFGVRVTTGSAATGSTVQGRAHDLSERGLSIYAPAEFEEGQQLQLAACWQSLHCLIMDCNVSCRPETRAFLLLAFPRLVLSILAILIPPLS
ncbi:MAG: hypothetical protein DMG60_03515 [Acidobacteria bacterium]|nr:MAG: hypothetical protein DMG60_03515 [Acidobacteriota bacterium]